MNVHAPDIPRFSWRFLPALVALSLFGLIGSAGADEVETPTLFVDQVDVNVINVEVFVSERDGRRARGLEVGDFEILADGEPVAITNFFAVDRRGYPGEPAAEMMLPGSSKRRALAHLPAEQGLHLLVYIDNYNLRPGTRNRVLRQMGELIDHRLENGDQVMVMSFDRQLEVLTPFTTNGEQIDRAFEEVSQQSGFRAIVDADRTNLLNDLKEYAYGPLGDPEGGYPLALDAIRVYERKLQDDFVRSAEGLRRATRMLAGLPGRKAVLYVSDGLSMLPGQELYEYARLLFGQVLGQVEGRLEQPNELADDFRFKTFEDIVADANANQVTIYSLDARGNVAGGESLSAEYGTLGGNRAGMFEHDAIREANLVAPLVHLAERTGGIAIRNTNNFDGELARMSQDFESFYSLGFRADFEGDGKPRALEVRVKRPGLDVRHRTAYVDKSLGERIADRTFSSLFIEGGANPLGIHVDFGPSEKVRRNRWVVPVIVRIPARNITFLPQDDQVHGQLRIFVAARDLEGGKLSTVSELPFLPSFTRADLETFRATGEMVLRTNLEMSGGSPRVAISVLDELSGVDSVTQRAVSLKPQVASLN